MKDMLDFSWITNTQAWIGIVTLIALEVVLGIDNIVFISILSGKVAQEDKAKAQKFGMVLAVIPRLIFLAFLSFILKMTNPLFYLPFKDPSAGHLEGKSLGPCEVCANLQKMTNHTGDLGITGQNLVLFIGGIFLILQATKEIHHKLEGGEEGHGENEANPKLLSLGAALAQIAVINLVFSLDSIVTAIGMVKQVSVMMIAVIISTIIMAVAVNAVSNFIDKHPSVKILALSFLLMIGATLIGEAIHIEIPKGYVYFAMTFSVFIELINIRLNKKSRPVQLNEGSGQRKAS